MENLHWNLAVLSRAIHHKNLSGAAAHVGLSQPQLSRIIARLEKDLNVVLLDRTVRRKSGWTPVAFRLAETYQRSSRKLHQAIQMLQEGDQVTELHIGSLEGLIPLAISLCNQLFEQTKIALVDLNVFDLSELEEGFEREELDLILTCREPGKQKFRHLLDLGYQVLEKNGREGSVKVMSSYEYASTAGKRSRVNGAKILMSNSLAVRRTWVDNHGGQGLFPSEVRRKRSGAESELPVYLIGSDLISPALWSKLESFCL